MVYQRGSQREGSPHYVLLYSDDEHSGDEESIPLQPCTHSTSLPRKVEVINVHLKSDDTLQALAVRYRCTISELKRINKIHKENEIFAKRYIKVPVQPFSILTESCDQTQSINHNESNVNAVGQGVSSIKEQQLVNMVTTAVVTEAPKSEINSIILNSICEPLSLYTINNGSEILDTEYNQLLSRTEKDTNDSHLADTFKCSGDDCGLSWAQLLGFSLLLGFAGPIIYILYIAEYSSKANH